MSAESPDPHEFLLPRPGWLCRMSKGFDFDECPGFEPVTPSQDAISPPYLFVFRSDLARAGEGEEFLLAHRRVKSCWEAWEIDEPRFRLKVSKRAALELTVNTQVVVYVGWAAVLADLAENYAGNRLLLDLSREERSEVRSAAEAVLLGDAGALEKLAAALEAAGDTRASSIRQLRVRAF